MIGPVNVPLSGSSMQRFCVLPCSWLDQIAWKKIDDCLRMWPKERAILVEAALLAPLRDESLLHAA